MKEVRLYELPLGGGQINLPMGSRILTAVGQPTDRTKIALYVEADANPSQMQLRTVMMFHTDDPFDDENLDYISSVQAGEYTWHVYQEVDYGGIPEINPL